MTYSSGGAAPAAPPAVDEQLAEVVEAGVLAAGGSGPVTASRDGDGALVLDVPPDSWLVAATVLRDVVGLDFLDWLSAVDQPDADPPGVDIVVHVADSRSGGTGEGRLRRALLRTRIANADGRLTSLTSVWPGTAWHERETFEMFGVEFDGFDDGSPRPLRPLLLPEGFEGHPLRKSFVLAARASKPWPGAKEPGESDSHAAPSRRKTLPPGVPDPATWPRELDAGFGSPAEPDGTEPTGSTRGAAGAPHEPKGDGRD